jgi:two-component system, OmpR family, phosphate regulon sensor histidine kinase PhoR
VHRVFSVALDRKTYLSLAYVLLRLPVSLVYSGVFGLLVFRITSNVLSLVLVVPAGLAIWGIVVAEREVAKSWFGARLTPMAPERLPDRTWQQKFVDLAGNPVTWKSLAYVAIESVVGFALGGLALVGVLLGVAGVLSALVGLPVALIIAILMGPQDVPAPLPFALVAIGVAGAAALLVTMYAARGAARAQVWFVRVMLGMSLTQFALAQARAEAATEHAKAEVADRSRKDLVLNVSHELRNPLATIRAHVDTLRGEGGHEPADADRKRYLEVLSRETDRLASLVDELLTLASADTGELNLDIEPVDAAEVATQVHDAMAPLAWHERHIQLLCNADGAKTVMADRGRLVQVLMNLVRNAITQTPEGGLVAIEVRPLETSLVEMTVSDTGPGVAPDEVEKIFERFYRTDGSRSRSTGGFGLGLAIAREMVEAMGGRISVESTPGQGSRFTVTLSRT